MYHVLQTLLSSFILPCHDAPVKCHVHQSSSVIRPALSQQSVKQAVVCYLRQTLFASCLVVTHIHPFVSHIPQTLFSPSLVNHAIVVLTRADAVLRDNECLADYMEKNARTPLGRLLVDDVDSRVMFVNNFASAYEMR